MSTRLLDELACMPCPHCPEGPGLELALRLELETECQVYFAGCQTCNRLYEVSPGGELLFETGERQALTGRVVRCPHCRSVGYAVSYALSEARAESHVVLTCRDCQHTFRLEARAS
jgi:RNase P subunit RPR2